MQDIKGQALTLKTMVSYDSFQTIKGVPYVSIN